MDGPEGGVQAVQVGEPRPPQSDLQIVRAGM